MIALTLTLAAAAILVTGMEANAATDTRSGDGSNHEFVAPSEPGIQLAQREVDVYIDEYGRQVLLDPWTGEVVGIIDPRQPRIYDVPRYEPPVYERPRFGERALREPPPRDPYYLDERALRALERRERRLQELGRSSDGLPNNRDYGAIPEEPYYDDEFRVEEPRRAIPDPVERQPLEDTARLEDPARPDTQGSIIEIEPDQQALPDASQPTPDLAGTSENVAKIQIVLDRMGASPGVIDGRIGDNVNRAIAAYRDFTGQGLRTYDMDSIDKLLEETGGPAFKTYEITSVDVAGPYVASIPEDYGEKARMERLGYTSVVEMLAERFHMDERYLKDLNRGVDFNRPGTRITVANVDRPQRRDVVRIVADKSNKRVRAYGADGRLVVTYPATIGSQATPSPTGTHKVERIALNPEYTYNPRINFQQGDNDRILTIPPGPNGPVGSVWIALSKPTYGIHGTPEPSKIGKTYSNGCIRLTNWDAQELAGLVKPGVTVEFIE